MPDSIARILVDENENKVVLLDDGGVYRLQHIGKVLDTNANQINPAKEDGNLASIKGKTDSIPSDPAREGGNLATLAAKDFATQATLAAIKDTDGIKKITEPLPAGTNNIGDVDVASSALPAGAATEATLATRASETTLSAADAKLGTIDGVLDGIKDTEGIKKITDPLPAGTNEIGAVKQGTKATGSGAWPTALYDASGNPVAVVLDNSIYRLETRTTIVGQEGGTGAEVKATIIEDTQESTEKRLQTEARLAPGSVVNLGTGIPADPAALIIDYLLNGTEHDMLVDGSSTPVAFTYAPPAGVTIAVQELLVIFTADDFAFDGVSFGPNSALTNGIKFETDIGGEVTEIFNILHNEDFLRVPGRIPLVNNTGPKDVLGVSFQFGGLVQLVADDGDQLIVTVRDDLTSVKLKYLAATIYGAEV